MRYWNFAFLSLLFCSSLIGQASFSATVVDEAQSPIPYCNVFIVGSDFGTLTDENGQFTLTLPGLNGLKADTLSVSRLGYLPTTISLDELSEISFIKLKNIDHYELATVAVTASKLNGLRPKKFGRPERKTNHYLQGNTYESYEIASFIDNTSGHDGIISDLEIYIGKLAGNRFPFRLGIYALDTLCNCPGQQLNHKEIIISAPKRNWNKADVKEQSIIFPATGVFISYQWLFTDRKSHFALHRHNLGIVVSKETNLTFERIGGQQWAKSKFIAQNDFHLLMRLKAKIKSQKPH